MNREDTGAPSDDVASTPADGETTPSHADDNIIPAPSEKPRRPRRWQIIAGSVAALAVAGGATTWYLTTRDPINLNAGYDWYLRSSAAYATDGATFNYRTGEITWEGSDLTTQAEIDERAAKIDKATADAANRVCEDYTSESNSPRSMAVFFLLSAASSEAASRVYTPDVIKALEEGEAEADRIGWVPTDHPYGSDEYKRNSKKRSETVDDWFSTKYPHLIEKRQDQQTKANELWLRTRTEENVADIQRIIVERCDIITPDNWQPATAADLELTLP